MPRRTARLRVFGNLVVEDREDAVIALPAGRVVIVGGGPTGLTLACELALAGVPCRVFERRTRAGDSTVIGLPSRALELLDLRGLATPVVSVGKQISRIRLASGGLLELAGMPSRFPYLTVVCRSAAEEILAARAAELGVEVIRGAEVVGLDQDDTGVSVEVHAPHRRWRERAVYVVGCDGADSSVRAQAGITFAGGSYDFTAIQADVKLGSPPVDEMVMATGPAGMALTIAYGPGRHRVTCLEPGAAGGGQPPTLHELRSLLTRVTGRDPDPQAPRWLTRHRLQHRLADRYRVGRVLVAGDAAHLHSPVGGQGVSLGVGDAVNLGWKLAAVVYGWAPPSLLETYEAERRPVAREVIEATDAVTEALTGAGDADTAGPVDVPERVLSRLLGLVPTGQVAAGPGSTVDRYASLRTPAGPLTGQPVPEMTLARLDGTVVRPHELLREGRFVLLDVSPDARCATAARSWAERVQSVAADPVGPDRLDGALAMLIRPDGYVAWSTDVTAPAQRARLCREALTQWCGAVRTARLSARASLAAKRDG